MNLWQYLTGADAPKGKHAAGSLVADPRLTALNKPHLTLPPTEEKPMNVSSSAKVSQPTITAPEPAPDAGVVDREPEPEEPKVRLRVVAPAYCQGIVLTTESGTLKVDRVGVDVAAAEAPRYIDEAVNSGVTLERVES